MAKLTITALVLLTLLSVSPASAQVSGETEIGTDNRNGEFAGQYIFYDWSKANLLTRYFWVNDAVNRAEIAIGPTVKIGPATWKMQFGTTTDLEVMVAGLVVGKVANRSVLYIYDGKLATKDGPSGTLYQKLFWAIDGKSIWQFRIESLHVGAEHAFLRIGGEYQVQFNDKHHIFVAPFYDPIVDSPGIQVGYRFF